MSKSVDNTRKNNGKPANRRGRPENLKPWPKGVSGNPRGAPKRGESWGELIKLIGDMTPAEAHAEAGEIGKRLKKYEGKDKTLKELVIFRIYDALLFDPQASLLVAFMDRAEGKLVTKIAPTTPD